MVSTKGIVTLVIGLTIAGSLLVPLSGIVNSGTGTVETTDTVTAQNGTYVELSGYNIQSINNVTDSDGNAVDSGNYTVDYDNGRIQFDTSGVVSDGESVSVSYSYQATTDSTAAVAGIVPVLFALLLLVKLANQIGVMQP